MTQSKLDSLNDRYRILNHVLFESGPGGLPIIRVSNPHALATISLHGGHVLSYQPVGHDDVLWISRESKYQHAKAIRGGVPICWPWFADHPTDPSKPAHGLVRTATWQVSNSQILDNDQTLIQLMINSNEDTLAIWPHPFELTLTITVGSYLNIDLSGKNTGISDTVCGGALHSYFRVGDIRDISIHGLDQTTYIDKGDGFKHKTQCGPLVINGFTDSVYLDTTAECVIEDPTIGRRIHVAKTNSSTTVVWNPWADKAASMLDFADDEYPKMVCVETANADDDVVTISPGQEHHMGASIRVEHM